MMRIYIAVLISSFVAFTNFIVLALICSLRRLQTLRNVPLAGLATADLLVGLFWIPLATASSYHPENKGLCRAALSFEILTMHASLFNLIAVSTERWIAIFKPLHYHQIASKTVVISFIVISWVLSFAMLIAFLLADKHEDDITECDIVKYIDAWLLYVILIIFYIVCGIMITMQLRVYVIVRKQLRKIRPMVKPGNVTTGLMAATSFIIEKSFHIDASSENDKTNVESQRALIKSPEQLNDCEGTEAVMNCEASEHKVKKQVKRQNTKKEKKKQLRHAGTVNMKLPKLSLTTDTFQSGRHGLIYSQDDDIGGGRFKHETESSLNGINPTIKICMQKKTTSTTKEFASISRTNLNKSNTLDSNHGQNFKDEVQIYNPALLEEESTEPRTRHISEIFCVENMNATRNRVKLHAQFDRNHVNRKCMSLGKMSHWSSRKQVYCSPDQESTRLKGTSAKTSLASFAKIFSVMKKQKKLEFARAAATNIVCLCFVLMWAPKSTIDLLTGLGYCDSCSLAHSISAALAWANSGINALIYAWRTQEFKEALRNIVLGKRRRSTAESFGFP